MTRKLKRGGYSAALSVIVIAAVIVLNMIVGRLPKKVRQWDISSNQIYSLGDTTKEVMEALPYDVTIHVVADPAAVDERIRSFVDRYRDLSPRIQVQEVDSILHPDKVKELNAENNTLLVTCQATGKRESIPMLDIIKFDEMSYYYYGQMNETEFDGEGLLTSAISRASNDVRKLIYAAEGHGEKALGSQSLEMLEKSSLTVENVNLLKEGGVPRDCDLLFINNPESDLADDERTMLTDYLDGGGKVMILSGYSGKDRPNLQAIFEEYGLTQEKGLAADTKNYYQNNPYYIFPVLNTQSQILEGVDDKTAALVLQSGGFSLLKELPEDVTVDTFMETSDGGVMVAEEGKKEGTYVLGAAAEKTLESGTARLTALASPSLVDDGLNSTFTNLSNLTIFMNAVTANFDDVENISIPAKSLEVPYNTVTHGGAWGLLFILVIPGAALAIGFFVWLKRRRM